jgi:hypothetical protein
MISAAFQVFSSVQVFFAPVNRVTGTPAAFDPATAAAFDFTAPPAPWLALGQVSSFRRTTGTAQAPLRAGSKGAVASQIRAALDARIDFDFFQWGKLQMALACGGTHNNVIATTNGVLAAPCAVLSGSTATKLNLSSSDAANFHSGDLVAVDIHYAGQTGYVGSGISAAFVSPGQTSDRDFIRRVTFNVARVASITGTALNLDQPLPGGAPPANSFVQKINGFTDREGSSFFQEWSAILFLNNEAGGRLCFYYPRLQCAAPAAEAAYSLDGAAPTTRVPHSSPVLGRVGTNGGAGITGVPHSSPRLGRVGTTFEHSGDALSLATLHASFIALPVTDPTDNEQVVCYRTYIPATNASVY